MKSLCFLVLFLLFKLSAGDRMATSSQVHITEKIYFYFNYQLEGLLGGDRYFAPDCKNCDFHQFVKHINAETKPEAAKLDEPTPDIGSIRTLVHQINTRVDQRTLTGAWLNARTVIPDIPSSTENDMEYKELYRRTATWAQGIQSKIDDINDDEKRKKAKKLLDVGKLCVEDMKNMRNAGYKSVQYTDAIEQFREKDYKTIQGKGRKGTIDEKDIPKALLGSIKKKYKEIDWAKMEKKGWKSVDGDKLFVDEVRDWVKTRAVQDASTRRHLAVENVIGELQKCYP